MRNLIAKLFCVGASLISVISCSPVFRRVQTPNSFVESFNMYHHYNGVEKLSVGTVAFFGKESFGGIRVCSNAKSTYVSMLGPGTAKCLSKVAGGLVRIIAVSQARNRFPYPVLIRSAHEGWSGYATFWDLFPIIPRGTIMRLQPNGHLYADPALGAPEVTNLATGTIGVYADNGRQTSDRIHVSAVDRRSSFKQIWARRYDLTLTNGTPIDNWTLR